MLVSCEMVQSMLMATCRPSAMLVVTMLPAQMIVPSPRVTHDPNVPFLMGYVANARAHLCDWSDYEGTVQRIVEGARSGRPVCVPFAFLLLSDDPAAQLLCATSCVRNEHSKV